MSIRWRHLLIAFWLCGPAIGAIGAAATAPASAPGGDVEIALTKIEPAAATVVSGKLKDASASEMFAKLADAAGVVITPADEGVFDDPSLATAAFSTQWERQPFWDALREACDSTNLRPLPVDQDVIGNAILRLGRAAKPQRAPASVDGPALVLLRGVMRDATIDYAGGNRKTADRVHVTLGVLLEPKMRGWAWIDPPRLTRAADERGHAMAPTTRASGERVEGHTYLSSSDVAVVLDYPPRGGAAGKTLSVLEGTIPIRAAGEMATVTFNQPLDRGARGAGERVKGAGDLVADLGADKLRFKSFVREDGGGSFKLTLVLSRGPKETDEHWKVLAELVNRFLLRPTLICPNGPVKPTGGSADQRDDYIRMERQYPALEADNQPTAVQVQLPGKFDTVNVKFSFKDVAMP